jgi:multidrug efflux pump subunit AcrB
MNSNRSDNTPQEGGIMRSVIRWAISNSPAMNTFLVASLIVGAISLIVMRREVFPNFTLEIVLVTVAFPGATPDEVEQQICQKVESAVSSVEGVKKVNSVANEGFGFVILELNSYVKDVQPVLNRVKSAIDQIPRLPDRSEKPEVRQIIFRAPAITVGVIGPKLARGDPEYRLEQEKQLRDLTESIREDLVELKCVPPKSIVRRGFAPLFQPKGNAISEAEIVAAKPYEVAIEIPEDTLREYKQSLRGLAGIIRQQNSEMPGGKMETPGQELLLRGKRKSEYGTEIAQLPLMTRPNGDVVTVADLGIVVDGFAETIRSQTINDRPGLAISVSKTAEEDLFTIVEAVKDYVGNKRMPAGYEIQLWGDISVDVQDRIDLLSRNGVQGLILVFIVLAMFLELRLAFWVAMGIPVSILGAGFILLIFGSTLNMLTMFAFLMALGIVVDDAIVIGENIYAKREEGLPHLKAAVEGTVEVLPSVFASVTTTIIAFLPLMFVTGVMGKFISVMPIAVIAMLVISLVESAFILPAHLAHDDNLFLRTVSVLLYVFKPLIWVLEKVNKAAAGLMAWGINSFYNPLLHWSLRNRRIVLAFVISLFVCSIGLIVAGIAPFAFFPKIDGREISASVAFPDGTAASFSHEAVHDLEAAFLRIDERIKASSGKSVFKNLYRRVGEVGSGMQGPTGITNGSHVGMVEVQLVQPDERSVSVRELIQMWREEIPKIPGAEALKFGSESMGPGGASVEVKLLAGEGDQEYLDMAAEECKEYLAKKSGVFDIEDDSRAGKSEMVIELNDQGKALDLDPNTLLSTVRGVYFGEEVDRIQRGRHEVKLMLRYPKSERQSMEGFESIRIRDNEQNEWPLLEVADVEFQQSYSKINRLNQKRAVTITADVDKEEGDAVKILAEMQTEFMPVLLKKYEQEYGARLSVNWEGEQAQTMESIISMFVGFLIALLCMFVLLTLEFRSYIQPLIILSIIPFGWVGAILGHAILDIDLTLFSFFGLIALTGVVVNDSIVLVDFINRRVRSGVPLDEALKSAGSRRFRPIMLTSMTTVAGLFPMLLETSMQAQVLIPMAASLIFGLATGTLLILILVPVFYSIYGSLLGLFGFSLVPEDFDSDQTDMPTGEKPAVPARFANAST